MELVGKLRFLNKYGELETVNPGDREEAPTEAVVGVSVAGVVTFLYLFAILFMFTAENVLACCFCPDGGIWASGTMMEEAMAE